MLCVSKQFVHDISIHAPRTGSDDNLQSVCVICHISIHAPRTGSDLAYERFVRDLMHISIHAPRTGSDQPQAGLWRHTKDFNPRSPHGEQQDKQQHISGTTAFQSTLPARGATKSACELGQRPYYFNPRSPHGERPKHGSTRIPGEDISIHAPCTGSDTERDTLKQQLDISIHAPCTGSDRMPRAKPRWNC